MGFYAFFSTRRNAHPFWVPLIGPRSTPPVAIHLSILVLLQPSPSRIFCPIQIHLPVYPFILKPSNCRESIHSAPSTDPCRVFCPEFIYSFLLKHFPGLPFGARCIKFLLNLYDYGPCFPIMPWRQKHKSHEIPSLALCSVVLSRALQRNRYFVNRQRGRIGAKGCLVSGSVMRLETSLLSEASSWTAFARFRDAWRG